MCGRYTLTKSKKEIEERFAATFYQEHTATNLPLYNACPSNHLPLIVNGHEKYIGFGKWGLVPPWKEGSRGKKPHINAKLETVLVLPSFKYSIQNKRCIIIADGYYEWQEVAGKKYPYYIRINSGGLFAFAALYESWVEGNKKGVTFSLITQPSNGTKLAYIHHRMPAILLPEQEKVWLNRKVTGEEAVALIEPFPDEKVDFHAVTTELNSSWENDERFIKESAPPPPDLTLFT